METSNKCLQETREAPADRGGVEKAARGTDGRPYPWGSEDPTCRHAVLKKCGYKYAQKPCSKPEGNSPYGICDMIGNAGEWVLTNRDEIPKDRHVMKGGSCVFALGESADKPYVWLRYSWEDGNYPDTHVGIGVRCVWSRSNYNLKLLPKKHGKKRKKKK
ncbi:MAG: hypothetical protein D6806_14230 [Deltaproteobacteria bacterium]|nr:MAG: hypothetical protein D6806_14230 [Deltaproteobacteria bacterium]